MEEADGAFLELQPAAKRLKLSDERAAPMPVGVNLIETADGKSCTHEVAWPPGGACMQLARG